MEEEYDYLLIQRFLSGDERAFDELFRKYFYKLYCFTVEHTGDEDLSKELVMDVLVRFWQRRERWTEIASVKAFLFRSVKNGIIDQYRKKTIKPGPLDQIDIEPVSQLDADRPILDRELEQIYHKGLQMLSPQQWLIFDMKRNQGLSHREIAENLNISTKTVENHMTAALSVLRKHFRNHADMAILLSLFFFCLL